MITCEVNTDKRIPAVFVPRRANDVTVIVRASWVLTDMDCTIVDSGDCEIDGRVVTVNLHPQYTGMYRLDISAFVPPQHVTTHSTLIIK